MAADLDHEQRLKAAVHYTVGKICEEQGDKIKVTYSREVIASISELVWRNIKIWTKDVEAFARHGKRSAVNTDDVKLLVRRNQSIREKIESSLQLVQQSTSEKSVKGGRGQKKKLTDFVETGTSSDVVLLDSDHDSNFSIH